MRLIIEPDYAHISRWAANYIAHKINAFGPTPENRSCWVSRPVPHRWVPIKS